MPSPSAARLLVLGDHATPGEGVRTALEGAGYAVDFAALEAPPENTSSCAVIVVDGTQQGAEARAVCQRLRAAHGDAFLPIVLITDDLAPQARSASLESGADAYILRPFEPAELLAQVQAYVRLKERHDNLVEKSAEAGRINKRLHAAYQQIDDELDLARRIQESFLPQTLPHMREVRFGVHYQPCGRVGGDFYDIFRLDEHHIGLYVADAMGHGVPASLLTIFVKKGVRAKEIRGQDYRLVPPGEVLKRLNHDMIEQELSESPFITMVYALLNFHEGRLEFARSGHPYPLYIPRHEPPVFWQIEGSLLGVFETDYPVQTAALRPGDKVLLYTDGMDAASFDNQPVGGASLIAAAEKYRDLSIQDLVDRLAGELFRQTRLADDLTLLGLEMMS
jgi:phosphoserine phosphatase RsbU/P